MNCSLGGRDDESAPSLAPAVQFRYLSRLDSSGLSEPNSPVAGSTGSEMSAIAEALPLHTFRKLRTGVHV